MFQHFPATTSDNHINDQYPFLKVSFEQEMQIDNSKKERKIDHILANIQL